MGTRNPRTAPLPLPGPRGDGERRHRGSAGPREGEDGAKIRPGWSWAPWPHPSSPVPTRPRVQGEAGSEGGFAPRRRVGVPALPGAPQQRDALPQPRRGGSGAGRDPAGPTPKQIKSRGGRREREGCGSQGAAGAAAKGSWNGRRSGPPRFPIWAWKTSPGRRGREGGEAKPPETTSGRRAGGAAGTPGPVGAAGETPQPPSGYPGGTRHSAGRRAQPGARRVPALPTNAPAPPQALPKLVWPPQPRRCCQEAG